MKSFGFLNLFLSISLMFPSVPFACQPNLDSNLNCTKLKEGDELVYRRKCTHATDFNEKKKSEPPLRPTLTEVNKERAKHESELKKNLGDIVYFSKKNLNNNASGEAGIPTPETKSEVTSNSSDIPAYVAQTQCVSDPSKVAVPKYAFYLIGFVMIILLAATIILGVLLYQNKFKEYQVFAPHATATGPINVDVARKYMTQTSQEMTLLNISSDNKNPDTIPKIETTNDISTKMPQSPIKIYKSVRKPVDHQMLLREQMKKICEDALARSQNTGIAASLKDLNTLLNEFDVEKSQESIVREKSASFPQLDIYDEPPARKKPVAEDDVDIPVYDCLPSSNNIIVRDYDSNYLMALSKENCSDIEPAYINAKYRCN